MTSCASSSTVATSPSSRRGRCIAAGSITSSTSPCTKRSASRTIAIAGPPRWAGWLSGSWCLDAVLADRRYAWLGTEQDKVAYFKSTFEQRGVGADPGLPHLVFGTGPEKVIRYFPDKMPIGVERDYGPRHVFLFLVTSEVPAAFRMFLFRHADLLGSVRQWTIRLLVPRHFRKAIALYRYAVRDELATPLTPSSVDELASVFRHRAGTAEATAPVPDFDLATAKRKFAAARFQARYRMWQVDPSMALWGVGSSSLRDQLARGEGRIEFMELPHQYLRLTSLVGVA